MTKSELEMMYPKNMVKLLIFLKKIDMCPHPVETVTPFRWFINGAYVPGHICEVCLSQVHTWEERKGGFNEG